MWTGSLCIGQAGPGGGGLEVTGLRTKGGWVLIASASGEPGRWDQELCLDWAPAKVCTLGERTD